MANAVRFSIKTYTTTTGEQRWQGRKPPGGRTCEIRKLKAKRAWPASHLRALRMPPSSAHKALNMAD
jgi:hypothetical protein